MQQVEVTEDQVRLGHQSQAEPFVAREFLEDAAGDAKLPFCRLIRIGGGPDRDLLARAYLLQLLAEEPGRVLLNIDLALEVHGLPQLHEFVRVSGITVFATKFAAAVGIDGPRKRHPRRKATREQAAILDLQILDLMALAKGFAGCGQTGDSHKRCVRL